MKSISKKLEELEVKKQKLLALQREERASRDFLCGCGEFHKINECTLIQTHFYIPPSGCSDGDYWNEGEVQIICPKTNNKNRVYFTPHSNYFRRKYLEYNVEMQFKKIYTPLFKSVIQDYKEDCRRFWNNDYFDKNREKFELCEKLEEI